MESIINPISFRWRDKDDRTELNILTSGLRAPQEIQEDDMKGLGVRKYEKERFIKEILQKKKH